MEAELFHADGRTDGRTDVQDGAFRNFATAPKYVLSDSYWIAWGSARWGPYFAAGCAWVSFCPYGAAFAVWGRWNLE